MAEQRIGTLKVHGIRQPVRIGCYESERAYPQMLRFDLTLDLDVSAAIASDSINDTVDYLAIAQAVDNFCREGEWKLIESCANDVGTELLRAFPQVTSILVTLHKNVITTSQGATFSIGVTREK